MGRKIIIVSGGLTVLVYITSWWLDKLHAPVADFVRFICVPLVTIVFLAALFGTRIRRISSSRAARNVFRGMRIAVLLGMVWLLLAIFLPRSYGSLPRRVRASTRYWDLPTGSRIAYTLIPGRGIRKPYPIIYLQGGPGGTIDDSLIRIMTAVSEDGYDIYLYDQIGSGWSARLDNIREYTADRHKRDLEAIVKMIHAPRVILIGQSWGAVLATLLAADDPGLVAAMIVTGPGPIQPTRRELVALTPPDSLHLHDPYYSNRQGNDLANNIRTHVMALMATQYGVKLASDKEADDFAGYLNVMVNRSTVYDTSRIRQMNAYNGAGYYAMVMTVHSFRKVRDPRPKLKDSPIPILVMKGQYDNQPWGFTHEYLDLFPNHRLVVFRDAGHCIFCEQREGYLSTIREFLREQDSLGR